MLFAGLLGKASSSLLVPDLFFGLPFGEFFGVEREILNLFSAPQTYAQHNRLMITIIFFTAYPSNQFIFFLVYFFVAQDHHQVFLYDMLLDEDCLACCKYVVALERLPLSFLPQ